MSGHVARAVALIVNPHAGGGRAARALPGVEARAARRSASRVAGRAHARPRARARAGRRARRGAGEVAVDARRRRAARRRRGRAARRAGRGDRRPARRARQRLRARGSASRSTPRPRATCSPAARVRAIDLGEAGGHAFIGIASLGFDSDANRIANEAPSRLGQLVYALRRAARAGGLDAGRASTVDGRRRAGARSRAGPSPRRNSKAYGGGMFLAPDAELDDGAARRRADRATPQAPLPARAAEGVQGHARARSRACDVLRGARGAHRRRPPVHRLRRRRPDRRAAGDRSRALPGALRVLLPRMSAARRQGRGRARPSARCRARAGAAAARRCRARCCMRLEPHAIGALGRAPAARQRGHLGHQRQDDDRGDGRRRSSSAPGARLVHNRAGANMAGGVATALLDAAGAGRSTATPASSRSTSSGSARSSTSSQPRALLLANLFRDQLDRYGELETIADRWAAVVAARAGGARSCSTPTTRSSPTSAATRRRAVLRRRGRRAWRWPRCSTPRDSKHCRRCGAPYVYDAVYLGHLGRYHCDSCGARAPGAAGRRRTTSCCDGVRGAALHAAHAAGDARDRACRCPASTTSTTRSAPPRCASRSASTLDRRRRRPASAVAPAFGRAETLARRRARAVDPAGQEPGRRQRGPAHARARGRRARPASRVLNDHIADGRDVSWVWDADFEVLARRVRRVDVQRHARRRDGAAAEVRRRARRARIVVEPTSRAGARPRAGAAAAAPLFALPDLHRDARAARPARRARRRRGATFAMSRRSSGTTSSAAATTADLPLWRELADREGGAGARRRRRHRPRRARPRPRAATRSSRSTSTPRCSTRCASARRGPRRSTTVVGRRARLRRSARRFALDRRADADDPAARRRRRPRGASSRRARAHLAPGGLLALALADALEAFDAEHDRPAGARPARGRRRASTPAARSPIRDLRRPRRASSASARSSARDGTRDGRATTSIALDRARRPTSSPPRAAPPGCAPQAPRRHPGRPTSTSARRW